MTKGIKLHEAMAARMRGLAQGFEAEIDADIPLESRRFQKPMLLRPQNPFSGHARRILVNAIANCDPQPGHAPGLLLPLSIFDDPAHVAELATRKMRENNQILIVYRDLTTVYAEHVGDQDGCDMLRVLPTPLKFRNKHRHLKRNEMITFGARRALIPLKGQDSHYDRGLFLGNDSIASRDWIAGEDARYAPPVSDLTEDWVVQFEAEISHLCARLARQKPTCIRRLSSSELSSVPIVTGQGSPARNAWFLRRSMTEEDMHLGGLTFDVNDPVLCDLRDLFEIALSLAHVEVAPNLQSAFLDLRATTPFQREVRFHLTGRAADENTDICRRLAELIPRHVLEAANHLVMFTPDNIERQMSLGGMALIRVASHHPHPSNHERIEMQRRLAELAGKIAKHAPADSSF